MELQISYCETHEKFKERNYETQLNYKGSKYYSYLEMIMKGRPVIHCEKVHDLETGEVVYYFYDMAKLLSRYNKDLIICTENNYEELYKQEKITKDEKYYFEVSGKHTRAFIRNLPEGVVTKVTCENDIDLNKYIKSVEVAQNSRYLQKQAEKADIEIDFYKEVTLDKLIAETKNKHKVENYKEKNDELKQEMKKNKVFER